MSRTLYKQDILEILYGATFLGAGGGGSLSFGLDMLEKLEKQGETIELELLSLDELEKDDYAAMVAGLGSPVAMLEGGVRPRCSQCFQGFPERLCCGRKDGKIPVPWRDGRL